MLIGLISDTHGSVKNFNRAVHGPLRDVEMILHAGDILYHGPKNAPPEGYDTPALAEALNALTVPLMIAKGNCDSEVDQLVIRTPILSPYIFLCLELKKIVVLHGENRQDPELERFMVDFDLDMVVHGHSHIPRIKRIGHRLIVNPGTPTLPNPSGPRKKTVATFDTATGQVTIRDIDNGESFLEDRL
jgi:uncharacterized protein